MAKNRDDLESELNALISSPPPSGTKRAALLAELDQVAPINAKEHAQAAMPPEGLPGPVKRPTTPQPASPAGKNPLQQFGQSAVDTAAVLGDAASLGFASKVAAGLAAGFGVRDYKTNLELARRDVEDSRERLGIAALPTAITGGAMLGAAALPARYLEASTLFGAGAKGTVAGAGFGAGNAAGRDEPLLDNVAAGAGLGLLFSPATVAGIDAAGNIKRAVQGLLKRPRVTPRSALVANKEEASAALDTVNVKLTPDAVRTLSGKVKDNLKSLGLNLDDAVFRDTIPNTARAVENLDAFAVRSRSPAELESARRSLRRAAMRDNNDQASKAVLSAFDDFTNTLTPAQLEGATSTRLPPVDVLGDKFALSRIHTARLKQVDKLDKIAVNASRNADTPAAEIRTIREALAREAESPFFTAQQRQEIQRITESITIPQEPAMSKLVSGVPVLEGSAKLSQHQALQKALRSARDDLARVREMIADGHSRARPNVYAPSKLRGPAVGAASAGPLAGLNNEQGRKRRDLSLPFSPPGR